MGAGRGTGAGAWVGGDGGGARSCVRHGEQGLGSGVATGSV